MNRRFTPDKHKRIRRHHEKKNKTFPTRNQPQVRIWSPTVFKPKLTDKTLYYTVDPKIGCDVDIKMVQSKLGELFGFDVKVYPNLFYTFDVLLGEKTTYGKIQEVTLKLLEEI